MRLSRKLASARKQRHISLGMASRYSGIPKATLWRYEKGTSRIPADALSVLAKLYGVEDYPELPEMKKAGTVTGKR